MPLRPLVQHADFKRGARDMVGTVPGLASWGFVTGVAMVKSGLSLPIALFMNAVVYAASAQLATMSLIATGAPMVVVWATAICLNLRFAIFSAGYRPYLGALPRRDRMMLAYFLADLSYALFMRRFPQPEDVESHRAYLWGGVAVSWPAWIVPSMAGIVLGDVLPAHWGLGFAGTLALLGIAVSLLVDRATWAAAIVAGAAALAAWALPLKLNIIVAIAAAIAVGTIVHRGWAGTPPAGEGDRE